MNEQAGSDEKRYDHLRTYAATQKQTTVERLEKAITQLEAEGRPVNTFTIKEVSGMDYMAYYRNREAFQLFQEHSTHLCKKREQEQAKRQAPGRGSKKRKKGKGRESSHAITVSPRDPLLDYRRPRLVELLHEARAERDEARTKARAVRTETEQRLQAEQIELESRYRNLLQEHMQCGVKIVRLEAELVEFRAFMERFRSSLRNEEQGS